MMSSSAAAIGGDGSSSSDVDEATSDDNRFSEFCRLCKKLEGEPSYNAKTKLISTFLKNGSSGGEHKSYHKTNILKKHYLCSET